MKRILVTPGGRKRYLEVLLNHLKKNRSEFDRWDIWINTTNDSDIQYIEKINEENDFVLLKYLSVPYSGNYSIGSFFKDYTSVDEIYIRLDDDIVYIQPGSIKSLFDARESNVENFLLYGNILNNSIMSHLHQKNGSIKLSSDKTIGYSCMDSVGWADPEVCKDIHKCFFERYSENSLELFKLEDFILREYERVSINAISWRGEDFAKFNGVVEGDEEQWLSVDKPRSIDKMNKVVGNTLFVHFAFFTQRPELESTDFLERYKKISEL